MGESAVTVGEKPEEYSIPKYLFRYRPFEDQFDSLRRILVNNEWYFGSRVAFDDQDDCKLPGIRWTAIICAVLWRKRTAD